MKETSVNLHPRESLKRHSLILFIALCLIACAAKGQSSPTTATLRGTVRDANGSGLPGASIGLRNAITNQTRHSVTDAEGGYRVSNLPVGDYEVSVESKGFANYVNPSVTLALGSTTTLDITLRPAGVSAEITVTDRPPAIDPEQTA
ncbi:MAG: carboxypeptidase-like regulatory domain-containing protein, partial [Acidobacteriota bacterium]|nr:carboxypeptidase-like regulatory domain-containing protein [Acidobacteriota bacterium]